MTTDSLTSVLHATRPRETAGSRTAGRYGYQTNIGILKLIELLSTGQEFCLVFDYFDDLAILDHPATPSSIRLYQIKTKDTGEWTMAALCKFDGKTKPRSYIARLYAHTESFGTFLQETGFISNAAYRVDLTSGVTSTGAHHRIASIDMNATEHEKVVESVENEYPNSSVNAWMPKLILVRAPLGVHNHEATIKGMLNDYFEKAGIAEDVSLSAVYEALHANIAEKTGFAQVGLSYPELLAKKSLTKTELDDLFERASRRRKSIIAVWDTVERDLVTEGRGSADILRLRTYVVRYQQHRSSRQSQAHALRLKAEAWAEQNSKIVETCSTITGLATAMLNDIDDLCGYGTLPAYAALIVESHEAIHATT
jgi:Cap4 dsDNA endonuclease